ncbi:MAG: WecB/TagA/CpsF family glycosyltransferase [Candidatus Eremiobacteraeota bacterium]|nr:WecB/TagA/CpsF family glycosyltransferase [Candidatus Eremiobacteraeota bacterium]
MVVRAQRDAAFRHIINTSQLSLCDTVGLLAVAKLRGLPVRERVTGIDLIENVCDASNGDIAMFFLGGADGIAEKARLTLQQRFPRARIVGTHSGFFEPSETPQICAGIEATNARILFVGLGFPRQEIWLREHLAATGCWVGVGVGGSFDVISGNLKRAPAMWRRFGLEWLYRLLAEPRRWRRQLALPYFVFLVILDTFASLARQKRSA